MSTGTNRNGRQTFLFGTLFGFFFRNGSISQFQQKKRFFLSFRIEISEQQSCLPMEESTADLFNQRNEKSSKDPSRKKRQRIFSSVNRFAGIVGWIPQRQNVFGFLRGEEIRKKPFSLC